MYKDKCSPPSTHTSCWNVEIPFPPLTTHSVLCFFIVISHKMYTKGASLLRVPCHLSSYHCVWIHLYYTHPPTRGTYIPYVLCSLLTSLPPLLIRTHIWWHISVLNMCMKLHKKKRSSCRCDEKCEGTHKHKCVCPVLESRILCSSIITSTPSRQHIYISNTYP